MKKESWKYITPTIIFLAALLVLLALGGPSANGRFYLDSEGYFRSLPYFQERSLTWEKIGDVIWKNPYAGSTRILPNLTFVVQNYFSGFTASSGRYFNLALHSLNIALVFILLRNILLSTGRREDHSSKGAMIGALLWGLNPFIAESAFYVIQRMTLLSATFYLAAVICYLKFRSADGSRRWPWFAAFGFSYTASVLSKENGVLILVGIMALELVLSSHEDGRGKALLKKLAVMAGLFILLSLVFALILGHNPASILGATSSPSQAREFTMGQRVLTQGRVLVHYLSLLAFPAPERISFIMKYKLSKSLFSPPVTLVAWSVIAALLVAAVRQRRRWPLFSLAVLWFFFNHIIESSFLMLEMAFVHRNYLPAVLIFLPVGDWVASREWKREGRAIWVLTGVVLILFGTGIHQRAQVWGNPGLFWEDAVKKSPGSLRGYINLGILYDLKGQEDKAFTIYREGEKNAFEEKPGFWGDLYTNMAIALMDRGRYREAEPYLDRALEITKNEDYLYTMAKLQRSLGNTEKGLTALGYLENSNPYYPDLHLMKALYHLDSGDLDAARKEVVIEINLYPNKIQARALLDQITRRKRALGR